ncbi:alanine racemase domain protein [Thermosulfidibacter takaii ABI70S6]|uniref:Pyridoxal phosphate homeostasis protein n=1 Tax=Thermosulfidibacter takaii (strain DSM 17441 / JCM 13301 / NBRC 103674 / ABI70S6) TaxID=1298851 RepID=A0A0S3QT79_THET7|nr:YggS family pyridoxal phosphate-dependent enzyme [Thermosulfidibacter takaii]BAT71533.1 alanine racemase domain protein [Thermosulfidibacter takaii ABI70S6]
MSIRENVIKVKERIMSACERSGRNPEEVLLIAVSKTHPPELIKEAFEAGITHFGENRVQEAKGKIPLLSNLPITWHMIGYLQRNKVKDAVKLFSYIHSVDREPLVDELEKRLAKENRKMSVLIEVNVAGEESKHGVHPEDALPLLKYILECKRLEPIGLMTVAPYVENPEEVRWVFRQLRELKEKLNEAVQKEVLQHLSMGMSNDFEVAIEEGATMVRIGTAIFGERKY